MSQIPAPPSEVDREHRLTALETRLDVMLPTLATKVDIAELKATLAETKSSLLIWGLTTAVAVVAILVSLMLFLARELEIAPADDSAAQPTVHTELGENKVGAERRIDAYASLSGCASAAKQESTGRFRVARTQLAPRCVSNGGLQ